MIKNMQPKQQNTFADNEEDSTWVGIWDRDNPLSVYSRVPNRFREALDRIPESVRIMDRDELQLHFNMTPAIAEARMKFWELFTNTTLRVRLGEIFNNSNTFYSMLENPYKTMWFLIPPSDILNSQKSVLEQSLEVLRKFVSGDTMWLETVTEKHNSNGTVDKSTKREINTKAIAEARKVMEAMTDRIHGTVAMRLQVQGQHQHVMSTNPAEKVQAMGVDEILNLGSAKPEYPDSKLRIPNAESIPD